MWVALGFVKSINVEFINRVATQLSSEGCVDPVPDLIENCNCGSAGKRTRALIVSSQTRCPLGQLDNHSCFIGLKHYEMLDEDSSCLRHDLNLDLQLCTLVYYASRADKSTGPVQTVPLTWTLRPSNGHSIHSIFSTDNEELDSLYRSPK